MVGAPLSYRASALDAHAARSSRVTLNPLRYALFSAARRRALSSPRRAARIFSRACLAMPLYTRLRHASRSRLNARIARYQPPGSSPRINISSAWHR